LWTPTAHGMRGVLRDARELEQGANARLPPPSTSESSGAPRDGRHTPFGMPGLEAKIAAMSLRAGQQEAQSEALRGFHDGQIAALLLDVGGSEIEILGGATRTLSAHRVGAIFVTLAPAEWGRFGASFQSGVNLLQSVLGTGYEAFVFPNTEDSHDFAEGSVIAPFSVFGVSGLRKVLDMHALVDECLRVRKACSLLLLQAAQLLDGRADEM
jgi:hypothetical protein